MPVTTSIRLFASIYKKNLSKIRPIASPPVSPVASPRSSPEKNRIANFSSLKQGDIVQYNEKTGPMICQVISISPSLKSLKKTDGSISSGIFVPSGIPNETNKDVLISSRKLFKINIENPKIQVKSDPLLTITPISANVKSKANIDYGEQLDRISEGTPLVWDDSRFNQSTPGDLFGFWKYKDQVLIHVVEKVSSPTDRLPSWSSNVGQEDRNVVQLSAEKVVIPWNKWIELDGAKRCMGTAPVKKGLANILEYYNNN